MYTEIEEYTWPMTLNELEGQSLVSGLFKRKSSSLLQQCTRFQLERLRRAVTQQQLGFSLPVALVSPVTQLPLSVRASVHLFILYLSNRLTFDPDFLHTCYRVLGLEQIPVYRQSACRWREVNHAINPATLTTPTWRQFVISRLTLRMAPSHGGIQTSI